MAYLFDGLIVCLPNVSTVCLCDGLFYFGLKVHLPNGLTVRLQDGLMTVCMMV